jgi:hypothetical protein
VGRLDLPDPVRDEDIWFEDRRPEIGSDAWIAAEIAAGRSGEEVDGHWVIGDGELRLTVVVRGYGRLEEDPTVVYLAAGEEITIKAGA